MGEKRLMMGNEAVARGAWEAGCRFASSYPGTPATEITRFISEYPEIYSEWSTNEKVAMEVAMGASFAGARSLVAMKQVGVNVAADPLFSLVYAGVNGGMVIVTADEPGLHSSQNEQDNRFYAKFAQVPMLEPSDSQEAYEMTKYAFDLSEAYDTPVFLRLTTRICHTRCVVETGGRREAPLKPYVRNPHKYAMVPSNAYPRHFDLERRQTMLEALSDTSPLNRIEMRSLERGVICSGISYQNVREVLPDFSVLKIGLSYPVPHQAIRRFAASVKHLYVVEENRPFLEEEIQALGIPVEGKEQLLRVGELSAETLRRRILHVKSAQKGPAEGVPPRPPRFCPGCGHDPVFKVLREKGLAVQGDIGCYGLASISPYDAIDTLICMGASIGMNHGIDKVLGKRNFKSVAVIGDSTFFHSGMTGLVNIVANAGKALTIILDNRITAMTGHQPNPATGSTAKGVAAPPVSIPEVCRALGVKHVWEVDAYKPAEFAARLDAELERDEPSVIVVNGKCVMAKH